MALPVERCRDQIEGTLRMQLPFDNEILAFILKMVPMSQASELRESISDFCPRWSASDQASLVSVLSSLDLPTGSGGGPSTSQSSFLAADNGPATSASSTSRVHQVAPTSEKDMAEADLMLAQMLQDEEDDLAFKNQRAGAGRGTGGKKGKKAFKPMNINFTVGSQATPAQLGTAAPSSLADVLRNRRQQQARPVMTAPHSSGDSWTGPRSSSAWAPSQDGLSWAERAQVASEQAEQAPTVVAGEARSTPLRLMLNTGGEYQVYTNPGDTLAEVKAKVEKIHNVPISRQRILYLGRELADSIDVRSIGLRNGQPLQLAVRAAPAPPPAVSRQAPAAPSGAPSQALAAHRSPPPQAVSRAPPAATPAPQHFNSSTLAVNLRLPGGISSSVEGLPEQCRVSELKNRIQQEHGIRSDHILLTFFGCPLPDSSKLADCGVASGANLQVSLRPPGAAAMEEASVMDGYSISEVPEPVSGGADTGGAGKKKKKNNKGKGDKEVGGQPQPQNGQSRGPSEAQSSTAPVRQVAAPPRPTASRTALVESVFRRCDQDMDGFLNEQEMRSFAICTGFDGPADAWRQEYRSLCEEHGCRPEEGVDLGSLSRLVDDESDSGCHCTDEELHSMVASLPPPPTPAPAPAPAPQALFNAPPRPTAASATASSVFAPPGLSQPSPAVGSHATAQEAPQTRQQLIVEVFARCDLDQDMHLTAGEMRTFATFTGFDGSPQDWEEEFTSICNEKGLDPYQGISLVTFTDFVNDESDAGLYCTDEELRDMIAKLPAPAPLARLPPGLSSQPPPPMESPPPPPAELRAPSRPWPDTNTRQGLIEATFRCCDVDGDGMLSSVEMWKFATFVGFTGDAAEWDEEYAVLLEEKGLSPADGVSLALFTEQVEDQSDSGCYCTDDELRMIFRKLGPTTY